MGSCSQGNKGSQPSKAIKGTAASPIFGQHVEVLVFRCIREVLFWVGVFCFCFFAVVFCLFFCLFFQYKGFHR